MCQGGSGLTVLLSEPAPAMGTELSGAAMPRARSTVLSSHQDGGLGSVLEAQ